MQNDWPYPGARWWAFDFHTHTPISRDTPWHKHLGDSGALLPTVWLQKFMDAKIDCVAVTDHNSGAWVDVLKTAYEEMKVARPDGFRELHLFPGVEISVNGGFHLLALFDPTATTSDIDSLLGHIQYDGTKGDSDGVTRLGAAAVVQAILTAGAIPIPAHVDDVKGLLRLEKDSQTKCALDANTIQQVLEISSVFAMERVNQAQPLPTVYHKSNAEWATVVGSDCHNFKSEYANLPGSKFTWIKMATPSLEGLRLALLDGNETSVRLSGPVEPVSFAKPEHFIESIEISEASLMGRSKPSVLAFSPYLNAVLGGRGTGKSTIVHALRLAYGRHKELTNLSANSVPRQTFELFNRVQKARGGEGGLLPNTALSMVLHRDGARYRIHRKQGVPALVEEYDDQTDAWKISESQAVSPVRFPVKIFSQGQIAALASDGQVALLDVIDDLGKIEPEKQAAAEAKRIFFATRAKLREFNGRLQGRDAINIGLADVEKKLKRFEEVSHATILKRFERTTSQAEEVERQISYLNDVVDQINTLAFDIKRQQVPEGLFAGDEDADVITILGKISAAIGEAKCAIEGISGDLSIAGDEITQAIEGSLWKGRKDAAAGTYSKIQAELYPEGGAKPTLFGDLLKERQRLEAEAKRLDIILKQQQEILAVAREQWKDVLKARRAISIARQSFLSSALTNNSFVKIDLIPFGRDGDELERSLRELLGCAERHNDEIYTRETDTTPCGGLVGNLLNSAILATDEGEGFDDGLKDLRKRLSEACGGVNHFGARFNKYLISEADKRPDFIDHILCWSPEDRLSVEHSRKGDGKNFQPIGQASAGQRAAAMLAFLLAHGTDPLIFDQPEDDLDNRLIYDLVVNQIRSNKQRRQIIVITHNPNIVVNGDAEMLYAMDFNHQCYIKRSGSLQNKEMREEICQIMEGGRDAFERRYKRLGRIV